MANYEIKNKNKKQPDAFISFFDRFLRWITEHKAKFLVGIGVILLGIVGLQIYFYMQGSQAKNIANIYEKALQAKPEQAMEAWKVLLSKNPPLQLGDFIRLNMAGLHSQQDKWEEAAKIFKELQGSSLIYVKDLSFWAHATALENAKKTKEALEAYEKLLSQKDNPYQIYGKLGKARVLRQMQNPAEAEKLLQEILQDKEAPGPAKAEAMEQWMAMKYRG